MEKNTQFLIGIADLVVVLAVIAVGIVAPLFRYKVFGKAAVIASLGFLFLGLGAVFDLTYHAWATYVYVPGNSGVFEQFFWMRTLLRGVSTVFGLMLLIAAFLMKRTQLVVR